MRTSPVLSTNSLATQSSTSISSSCNSSAAAIGAGPVSNNGSPNSIVSPGTQTNPHFGSLIEDGLWCHDQIVIRAKF